MEARGLLRRLGPAIRRGAPALVVVGGLALTAGGVTLGLSWAANSPRFALTRAEVQGLGQLQRSELDRALEPHMGKNLLRIDTDEITSAVKNLAWVESAEVSRSLPNRLRVEIRERRAAAVVSAGGLYLASADGKLFKRAAIDRGEGAGLIVITGLERENFGSDSAATEAAIRGALAVESAYERDASRPLLGEIHIDPELGFTLVLADGGARLHVGSAQDDELDQRLRRFDSAWAALDQQERSSARTFFMNNQTRTGSVTVAFAQPR